ncbi:MAG: iron-sulfur cluster-binding protein [Gammaproteobacteria bacterium]|nr:iron-sulfur cluster-binding protein [Gammaproteobacteria bacterium]
MNQTEAFYQRIEKALQNDQVRQNIRSAMNGLMQKRAEQFNDPEELSELREKARSIRHYSLAKQAELLEKLEQKLIENGIQVHWAETAQQANNIISTILKDAGAKTIVKGKSMVSEEIGLNDYLEQQQIEVLESDLGEFIIQLAKEPPSHIVAPAIHKNRQQIAKLFHHFFPELSYSEDVNELTLMARKILREKFEKADAGVSGVNFAVAETGTLCLVENEGNGRLSTTSPDLHIAITGIEKVVEKLSDIPGLLNMLTKSATGQTITTYFNMISRPRQPDEKDGPRAVHLVLLDNGRSRIRFDNDLLETLRCIRCGSCMNHCPVYVHVGGHAYGTTYPGPIGTVLEPQLAGINNIGALTSACSLCGACAEVCPVKIPLPKLINQLRAEAVNEHFSDKPVLGKGSLRKTPEVIAWSIWQKIYSNPFLYKTFSWFATSLNFLTPSKLGKWSKYRTVPKPAKKSLNQLAQENGFDYE